MSERKICLATSGSFGLSTEAQIRLFRKIGFDGFFTDWTPHADIASYRRLADELGMLYQSIHAPFANAALMWKPREAAQPAIDELLACLEDCAEYGVPIMVVHAFIGFEDHDPTPCGVENFRVIVERARALGVSVAFENTEGEEYLDALLEDFKNYVNVGFCWDTGHEQCYNRARDMTAAYGDRLIATHLNDNLGITDPDNIFWTDDLHLLPFDGITDWQSVADRLNRCGFAGPLTFELTTQSKPGRHENDPYAAMPLEDYLREVLARARKLAAMMD
ncbi:MAG: sugar phosphate isomerase/epimerase [Clostridia bacterium]|nr:sugar phosphate isomerase/epimerase [Clostridia bacterium]